MSDTPNRRPGDDTDDEAAEQMPPTTMTKDYMGRALANAVPGTTTDVRDHMGRAIQTGNRDYLGRSLVA